MPNHYNDPFIGTGRSREAERLDTDPGRFTPFRDLWQHIAGAKGITTKRMREGMLEQYGADLAMSQELDRSLSESLMSAVQFADNDMDREQFAQLADQQARLQQMSQHHDPQVRADAMQQMLGMQQYVGAELQDIEDRQRALYDRDWALRSDRRDEYRQDMNSLLDLRQSAMTEYNTFQRMLESLGANNPAVQGRFRNLIDQSFTEVRDESGRMSFRFMGLGLADAEESYEYSYEEMAHGALAWLDGATGNVEHRLDAYRNMAEADGFQIDAQEGHVVLEDLNVYSPPSVTSQIDEQRVRLVLAGRDENIGVEQTIASERGQAGLPVPGSRSAEDTGRGIARALTAGGVQAAAGIVEGLLGEGRTEAARSAVTDALEELLNPASWDARVMPPEEFVDSLPGPLRSWAGDLLQWMRNRRARRATNGGTQ